MILRKAATNEPIKVLTGSANFSIRGLYVQANNILVFDDPDTAGWYAKVFDEVWSEKKAATSATEFAKSALVRDWTPRVDADGLPPFQLCFSPHPKPKTGSLCSLKKVADAIDGAVSSVLFAVMELSGSGSVMQKLKQEQAKNPDLFWYGVTQSVSADGGKAKKGGAAVGSVASEKVTGVTVSKADGKHILVPFAYLHGNVPAPFNAEVNGGSGQVIHNKFVVVDFNGPNATVFTGSSNLADGGEEANGDNLIGIYRAYDPRRAEGRPAGQQEGQTGRQGQVLAIANPGRQRPTLVGGVLQEERRQIQRAHAVHKIAIRDR